MTTSKNELSALDTQVGGDHYKVQGIQPVEYIHANKLNFFEGSAIKYITRHRLKNGKQDLEKAIHYLQMLIEFEYPAVVDEKPKEESKPNRPNLKYSVIVSDEKMTLDRLGYYEDLAANLGLHRVVLKRDVYAFDGTDAYGTLTVVGSSVEEIVKRYHAMKLGNYFFEVVNEADGSGYHIDLHHRG